jgi:hypothetical protein
MARLFVLSIVPFCYPHFSVRVGFLLGDSHFKTVPPFADSRFLIRALHVRFLHIHFERLSLTSVSYPNSTCFLNRRISNKEYRISKCDSYFCGSKFLFRYSKFHVSLVSIQALNQVITPPLNAKASATAPSPPLSDTPTSPVSSNLLSGHRRCQEFQKRLVCDCFSLRRLAIRYHGGRGGRLFWFVFFYRHS